MKATELKGLRNAIEKKFKRKLRVLPDFEEFRETMTDKLSIQTLRRIWGKIDRGNNIRETSVNVLARHLNYENYEDFVARTTLETEDQLALYTAHKIAILSDKIHSERLGNALVLLQNKEYAKALKLFSDKSVQIEITNLGDCSVPFVDNIQSVVGELAVKALLVWNCHWQETDVMERVDEIYNQALPLAQTINNHYLLWNIYQDWAFKHLQSDNWETALTLYEKAYKQGEIINIESNDSEALAASINDYSMLLCDQGEYQRAKDDLERALPHHNTGMVGAYLMLNYSRACYELGIEELAVEKFNEVIKIADQLILDDENNNEKIDLTHHVRGLALYNLGIITQENEDTDKAKEYFTLALEAFSAGEFPNTLNRTYRDDCRARLEP